MKNSEIRKDFIVDRYVVIAPRRNLRPTQLSPVLEGQRSTTKQSCVFCPDNIDRVRPLAVVGPKKQTWDIKVIKNVFPAVSLHNPRAYGVQEVVIETSDHTKQLDDLSLAHISRLFGVYADRTRVLTKNKKIEYILIFKNSGGRAGASIEHSHSQIFATNFIPPQLLHRSRRSREYKLRTRHCAYCDMIRWEERSPRLVYKDHIISVFCPYASENNFEIWLLPRRHIDNITMMNAGEQLAFARHLKHVLKKITNLHLPYNFYFHQVVNDEDQHLYLKIRPRGTIWAGVEIGSGIIINPIPPEDAARYYRKR
jgi:UDPglucose--hexose-1-phosphate uridylyltransferase